MELNDYLALPYTIRLRRDEAGDWIARIEELKGCIADGTTQAEALADLEQAKREWLQAALEDGVPIPAPESDERLPSGRWLQRVPRSLHKELSHIARAEGTSLNQYVLTVLARHVGGASHTSAASATTAAVVRYGGSTLLFAHRVWGAPGGGASYQIRRFGDAETASTSIADARVAETA